MDHFSQWVLGNAKKLNLKIENLTWIEDFFPNFFDVAVSIEINDKIFEGRGNGDSRDLSLKKAMVESIERAICLDYAKTTNGIAAHTDNRMAELNARNELLERDLFLNHFYTNTPFIRLETNLNSIPESVHNFLKKNQDKIGIWKMLSTNLGQGYVCSISSAQGKWGCILGLAFGQQSEVELITKSLFEAFRQYTHLVTKNLLHDNHNIDQFLNLRGWIFDDHKKLALNPEYYKKIEFLFPEAPASEKLSDRIEYSESLFSFRTYKPTQQIFKNCPIFVTQCFGDSFHELPLGPSETNLINIKSLQRFLKDSLSPNNPLPHPIN